MTSLLTLPPGALAEYQAWLNTIKQRVSTTSTVALGKPFKSMLDGWYASNKLAYDEQLRHHADMRITLDLDDGVKVNYGKFGDLLAEVKAVTGGRKR